MKFGKKTTIATLTAFGAAAWLLGGSIAQASGPGSHVHGIQFDRGTPGRILIATHEGLFAEESGASAQRISDHRHDMMGFAADPADPKVLLASGHPARGGNLGVLRSEDGGRSWNRIADGAKGPVDFHAMTISPSDPKRIYGLYGSIQMSRDGGRTWEIRGAPKGRRIYDIAASGRNPDHLYAATDRGIMISRDAGKAWTPADIRMQPASMVEVTGDGRAYAYVLGVGLLAAPDGSPAWKVVGTSLPDNVALMHLAADPADPDHFIAADTEGRLQTSTDGGKTWREMP